MSTPAVGENIFRLHFLLLRRFFTRHNMHLGFTGVANDIWFTMSASSWVIPEKGVPLTSIIVSPGRRPARSATDPSSMREMYTPMPADGRDVTQSSLIIQARLLTGLTSAFNTNSEPVGSVGLDVSHDSHRPCHHWTLAAVPVVGRRRDWRRAAAVGVQVMVARSRRQGGGEHSFRWTLSLLLTILFQRLQVAPGLAAGRRLALCSRVVVVEVRRMGAFDDCIRGAWWGGVVGSADAAKRYRAGAVSERSRPIISCNVLRIVAVSDVSHATWPNRLVVERANIASATWRRCPAVRSGDCRWCVCKAEMKSKSATEGSQIRYLVQRNHYWLRAKDHLLTKIPVACLNLCDDRSRSTPWVTNGESITELMSPNQKCQISS